MFTSPVSTVVVPITSNLVAGVVVPMPTLPRKVEVAWKVAVDVTLRVPLTNKLPSAVIALPSCDRRELMRFCVPLNIGIVPEVPLMLLVEKVLVEKITVPVAPLKEVTPVFPMIYPFVPEAVAEMPEEA